MPITTTRTGRIATARELADTVVPLLHTAADGRGFQLIDQYGVTYTGKPSHLALAALIRTDLTPQLYRDDRTLQDAVRTAASRIGLWFTCDHVDPGHAAAFAALSPARVCELVAHVVNCGHESALVEVGPESLRFYTAYLISDAVDDPEAHFPNVVDKPRRGLTSVFDDRIPLDITATAPDGADEVRLRLDIEANEEIRWDFVAAVPVPIAKLNDLLMGPSWALSSWLDDNRELIDDHLDYSMSWSDQGIDTDVRLAGPAAQLTYPELDEPAEPAPRADVALYFVGPDRDTAVTSAPFLDRTEATTVADALGHQVFTTAADIAAAALRDA
ncbi:hypothetical protein [Haloechinothrix halophila]|uniref:hypothetical protein n=1 Tax=Haloechinothrix halophila TaxID=1069073 RepID=UPI000421FCDB|nr:hypothetical protein [Haloechinothrix halophila]